LAHGTYGFHHAAARHDSARLPVAGYKRKERRSADFAQAPALLVMFICNHCPYVKHIRAGLAQLARDYQPRGVAIVGISTNDAVNYPEDSPAKMQAEARAAGTRFRISMTRRRRSPKPTALPARRTSSFRQRRKLVYRGQYDDSRPGNGVPITARPPCRAGRRACRQTGFSDQKPSLGCNIKWKTASEPEYS